jgi:DNA repair photolyase
MPEHPYRNSKVGRGAAEGPPNRFLAVRIEDDWEHLTEFEADELSPRAVPTEFLPDASQSIVSKNSSPDIPFNVSLNPYRGCEHGCGYCYARPTHEYLGFGAGLDFETKIMVKHDAAALLRAELCKPSWRVQPISFSGVTDCYQPAERRFLLTRACLEVLLEARHPVTLITKNALILRDLDLLSALACENLVHVALSITTLDSKLARSMEPRTSTPAARLAAIRQLSAAKIPVMAMNAPIIPGLNDHETPAVLAAAHAAGATAAGYVLLRLPLSVEPVFSDWLMRNYPEKADKVLGYVRSTRAGRVNDGRFGSRMRGEGVYADQIAQNFKVFRRKLGFSERLPELDCTRYRPPDGQGRLF